MDDLTAGFAIVCLACFAAYLYVAYIKLARK